MRNPTRNMSRKVSPALLPFLLAIVLAGHVPRASAQDANVDVQARLALADNQSVFRIGDPIRLVLAFTARTEGYQLNVTTNKPADALDEILLSPSPGVYRWLERYRAVSHPMMNCVVTMTALTPEPARVELTLNDHLRFDRPGKYTVRVKTNRLSRPTRRRDYGPPLSLATNEVSFEVIAMTDEEEEREVRRLAGLLGAAANWQEEAKVAEELAYLTGEAATREKVRAFLGEDNRSGNYAEGIYFGLFMARDRALVIRLLEAELRDTTAGATHQLLSTLVRLRMLTTSDVAVGAPHAGGGDDGRREHRRRQQTAEDITGAYVDELAASLARRAGKSRTTTAMTILGNLPQDKVRAAAALAPVREILLQEFNGLHPYDQEHLLRNYWEQIKNRTLAPALERMLTHNRGPQGQLVRTVALQRLMELAPESARGYVVAEINDPTSLAEYDVLRAFDAETLPETDAALLARISALAPLEAGHHDGFNLKHKAMLAARYATSNIYDEVLEIYNTWGAKWPPDARAGVLAYLARHNEARALPLIRKALGEIGPPQLFNFLPDLARLHYSEAIGAMLRERLESDLPEEVNTAGYLMSLYGPETDRHLLAARLERWFKEQANGRDAEAAEDADDVAQSEAVARGMVQVNLIMALINARNWKLPEAEVERLKRACVGSICRQHFPAQ